MATASRTPIIPRDKHVVTAHEALEPLYERLELQTDRTLLSAAVAAGWSAEEANKALATLRLKDAMATLDQAQ